MENWLEMKFEKNLLLWDFFSLTMTECLLGKTSNQQIFNESCQLLLQILFIRFYMLWLQTA